MDAPEISAQGQFDLPVGGRRIDCSNATFERRALLALANEQKKLNPDSSLIALFCDAVRITREYNDAMQSIPVAPVGQPEADEEKIAKRAWEAIEHGLTYEGVRVGPEIIFAAIRKAKSAPNVLSYLDDKEKAAVEELCERQQLTPRQVMRCALREYQMRVIGPSDLGPKKLIESAPVGQVHEGQQKQSLREPGDELAIAHVLQKAPSRFTLEALKVDAGKRSALAGKLVHIWQQDHGGAWWRSAGAGYTLEVQQAGIYTFEEAWSCSHHCGPEKGIVYEVYAPDASADHVEAQGQKELAAWLRDRSNLIDQFALTFRTRLNMETTMLTASAADAIVRYACEALADETAELLSSHRSGEQVSGVSSEV